MARIKIKQEIDVYEVDDKEIKGLAGPVIGVESHWIRDNFVVLEVDGKRFTVVGDDLNTAIENAMNSGGI